MAVIETVTFRLVDGTGDEMFVAADARLQVEFAYQQPGLARRTTARGDGGEWITVSLWESSEAADAAGARAATDPAATAHAALITDVRTARYTLLG